MADRPAYLKNLKSESVVQRVINCLTDGMISGELKPGDKLPTEPELAANFGVARTSVREATKILTYMGVLESRRSEGTFVSSGFQESMIDPMVYGIILNKGDDFDSLMELRELIEVGILQLAVKKEDKEGLDLVKGRLDEFASAVAQTEDVAQAAFQADNAFHDAVSALCKNTLVSKIDSVVRMLTYSVRWETVQTMIDTGRGEELLEAHRKIYDMLAAKDLQQIDERIRNTYFLDALDRDE
ncbi:MAG: GntR family transcriptional regulator [Clostridiales bacterium]|nr:GntR family transcriptional regulator [Clostridiales bacterium]